MICPDYASLPASACCYSHKKKCYGRGNFRIIIPAEAYQQTPYRTWTCPGAGSKRSPTEKLRFLLLTKRPHMESPFAAACPHLDKGC